MTLGLCECGCGQPTSIPTKSSLKLGRVRGVPMRFIRGHVARVRNPMGDAVNREKVAASKRAERHPRWQSDPNYKALHLWVNRNWPRSGLCESCGGHVGTDRGTGTQWSSIGHIYTRARTDWRELCGHCHRATDRAHRAHANQLQQMAAVG